MAEATLRVDCRCSDIHNVAGMCGVRSSPGILVVPLENEFHWSLATISFAISINLLLYGLIGPFAAAMMNSFGIRSTMLAALMSVCIGVAVAPLMQQSWQFVLLWGVLVGAGTGFTANVLAATVATRWFRGDVAWLSVCLPQPPRWVS